MTTPRTYVLGLGNILMGDDGFGPAVVRALEATHDLGEEVGIVDLGTPGLDLTPWFADADHIVVVDTVKADLPAGTLRLYDKSDLMKHAPFARVGPHDPGVRETLFTLEFAGRAPERVTVVGVVPERVGMSLDLSPAVAGAVPAAIDAVLRAIGAPGTNPA
jgi:hydrogenase maturation protease